MSANLFDAGDMQRLEREESLSEQRPRQSFVEDRSPEEDIVIENEVPENPFDIMLNGLIAALKERL